MEIQYFQVTDPLEGIIKISYDESGNVSGVTDANGGVTRYAYDSVGRLLEEFWGLGDILLVGNRPLVLAQCQNREVKYDSRKF